MREQRINVIHGSDDWMHFWALIKGKIPTKKHARSNGGILCQEVTENGKPKTDKQVGPKNKILHASCFFFQKVERKKRTFAFHHQYNFCVCPSLCSRGNTNLAIRHDGLPPSLAFSSPRHALNDARLLHESRVQLCRHSRDDLPIIARETSRWRSGGCSAP